MCYIKNTKSHGRNIGLMTRCYMQNCIKCVQKLGYLIWDAATISSLDRVVMEGKSVDSKTTGRLSRGYDGRRTWRSRWERMSDKWEDCQANMLYIRCPSKQPRLDMEKEPSMLVIVACGNTYKTAAVLSFIFARAATEACSKPTPKSQVQNVLHELLPCSYVHVPARHKSEAQST